jgi:hypothetical protein
MESQWNVKPTRAHVNMVSKARITVIPSLVHARVWVLRATSDQPWPSFQMPATTLQELQLNATNWGVMGIRAEEHAHACRNEAAHTTRHQVVHKIGAHSTQNKPNIFMIHPNTEFSKRQIDALHFAAVDAPL